jgi:hypothetical protein
MLTLYINNTNTWPLRFQITDSSRFVNFWQSFSDKKQMLKHLQLMR